MKAILICPAERQGVAALSQATPLSNVPILGKALVEHWLDYLVDAGASEVRILAADRPHQVQALVGQGARWGVQVTVVPQDREPSANEARERHRSDDDPAWLQPHDVILMDHLPRLPDCPLFASLTAFRDALERFMPHAASPERIGVREIHPGIWVGLGSHISGEAELRAPCWIGAEVHVGPETVVGPMAVIEDGALVERGAEISRSIVGPDTFVGEFTELSDSIAIGNTLANCKLESWVKVSDSFLLCSLSDPSASAPGWLIGTLSSALNLVWLLPARAVSLLKTRGWIRPMDPPMLVPISRPLRVAATGDNTLLYEPETRRT